LKIENEQKTKILHDLQIENDSKKQLVEFDKEKEAERAETQVANEGHGDEDDDAEAEYSRLSKEIYVLQTELDQVKERKKNI